MPRAASSSGRGRARLKFPVSGADLLGMARSLRFALLVTVLAAVFAAPAQAARMDWLPETLTSQHFRIHFDGAVLPPAKPVLHQDAGDLAGNLERAYTTYTVDWGYPAPLPDADALIDVYVTDLGTTGFLGVAYTDDAAARQSSGYIQIDDELTSSAHVAAHELFHLVQIGQWQPMDGYVMEGSAEWAGFRFLNFPAAVDVGQDEPEALVDTLGAPDMSLTCSGPGCGATGYEAGGYSRWHFYEYLTERFGNTAVKDLFLKAKSLNDPTKSGADIMSAAVADKGATLADVFSDWSVANLTGDYQAAALKGVQPPSYSTTLTGIDSGTLAAQKLVVNHLATRYVAFQRGSGSSVGPCHAA